MLCCLSGTTYDVITKTKKGMPERKTTFFSTLKAFQISSNYILLHGHFKFSQVQSKFWIFEEFSWLNQQSL